MRVDSHACVAPAHVRAHETVRQGAYRHPSGQVFALAEAKGLPRLWPLALDAVLGGFEGGLGSEDALQAASVAERLELALRAARRELRRLHSRLVERLLPDAALLGLDCSGDGLEIVGAGDVRTYVHRGGETERLTPRERPSDALLRGTPFRSRTELHPGDVVLAGSETAFSQVSIRRVASVLGDAPETPAPVLADLLAEPAAQAGVGAVAVVLRVR
jgi:hypothetical protein